MQEEVLRALIEGRRKGREDRRALVARPADLGIAAPLASLLLASLSDWHAALSNIAEWYGQA